MKRFMKGCAITALIFVVLGLILGIAAGNARGRIAIEDTVEAITGGRVRLQLGGFDSLREAGDDLMDQLEGQGFYDIEDAVPFVDGYDILEGDVERYALNGNIRNLDIEIGGCVLYLEQSPDEGFYLEAKNAKKLQGYVEGDTLYVKALRNGNISIWNDIKNCKITLYVPWGVYFDSADLSVGGGQILIDELNAGELFLEAGAGEITAENLQADTLEMNVGAGNIELYEFETRSLYGEVGVGFLFLQGNVTEYGDIQCSMGSVEMYLEMKERDYNYAVECGMGSVEIGNRAYSGLSREQYVDNGAARRLDVNCAMGSVEIYFD